MQSTVINLVEQSTILVQSSWFTSFPMLIWCENKLLLLLLGRLKFVCHNTFIYYVVKYLTIGKEEETLLLISYLKFPSFIPLFGLIMNVYTNFINVVLLFIYFLALYLSSRIKTFSYKSISANHIWDNWRRACWCLKYWSVKAKTM